MALSFVRLRHMFFWKHRPESNCIRTRRPCTHPRAKLVPETKLKRPFSVRSQLIDCPNSVGYTVTRLGAPELNAVPREVAMNCYVCVQSGQEQTAAGICRFCSVALCASHMADVQKHNQGGMHYTCNHRIAVTASE